MTIFALEEAAEEEPAEFQKMMLREVDKQLMDSLAEDQFRNDLIMK